MDTPAKPVAATSVETHMFSSRSNARLTFIVGAVVGICLMTLLELVFMNYVVSGGNIGTYMVAPLESAPQLFGQAKQTVATSAVAITVPSQNSIIGAKENYAVTLVEYVDFECRFCKKFFPEVLQFANNHPDKVRLIIKHYPLTQIHPQAEAAAIASVCATTQNKLVDYANELFKFQTNLSEATYRDLAKTTSLQQTDFEHCFTSQAAKEQIATDSHEAEALGIHSQPALVIWYNDGTLKSIDGYVNRQYLESALSEYLQ